MANQEHVDLLKQGVEQWNAWREKNQGIRSDLSQANFMGADLSGADLSGADLSGIIFREARLIKANFTGANLHYANLSKADLLGATFKEADLSQAILPFANLMGADLGGADLRESNLRETTLMADLRGANLRGADLSGATLVGADLSGADLSGATLTRANLSEANLRGADLSRAIFGGTSLVRADLRGAKFSDVNLKQNVITDLATCIYGSQSFFGSQNSLGEVIPTFRIRILEEPLTPSNLLSALSVVTELATKCWLIAHGRFAELIQYAQTHDVRFVEESQLHFIRIMYNSPFDASFKIDISASNVAEGIVTTINGITQAKAQLKKAELENEAKALENEAAKQKAMREDQMALVDLDRQALVVERERLDLLEKRLDLQKKAIEYALEVAARAVAILQPDADDQIKAMLIQTLLPTLLHGQTIKGLELVLPPTPRNEKHQQEQPE